MESRKESKMRNIVEEVYMGSAHYVFKTGISPDVVLMNKVAFDMAVCNSELTFKLKDTFAPGLKPIIFGIEVKVYTDNKEEPEWYFGMKVV